MKNSQETTVILGGTGKTGQRVAARLEALGRVARVVSRSTKTPFDWAAPDTWRGALQGAGSVYVTYSPDLAIPGAAQRVHALSQLAVELGLERIVLLAGRGEPQVHPAEQAVRESGAQYTIVECAFFNQNFSEGLLTPVNDTIAFPGGTVAEPFVDCDDIADVVCAALTDDTHLGRTYELTGPRCLTFAEVAQELSFASGRPITYQPVSFDDYGQMLEGHLAPAQIEFFLGLFRFLMDGHNAHTSDDIDQVLGRPATDFREYAKKVIGKIKR